jgi:hypothetical protein
MLQDPKIIKELTRARARALARSIDRLDTTRPDPPRWPKTLEVSISSTFVPLHMTFPWPTS